ncbi:MAG: pantoate--beta-alanine ligase [Candidatus Kapabacteria bacterium]|nr:pantoate--beta-alanine ligase [Candidatus Kapabacteria bacterium]
MEIIKTVREMQEISIEQKQKGKNIGFVPTMGYLHEGHLSLIRKAKEMSDIVITSIYVNPTQFAPNEDFSRYPRDFERDKELAEKAGSDFIFYPSDNEMYPNGFDTMVLVDTVTKKFEGEKRPTHFNGVATVVTKLFNAVMPNIAFFGQKDYQQTLVIKKLVEDLLFPISIYIVPTLRQSDGLAMSSRNVYLSTYERTRADIIYRTLITAKEAILKGEKRRKIINAIMLNSLRSEPLVKIDYASAADANDLSEPEEFNSGQLVVLLIAVYIGKTRLIDNMLVTIPQF